jgi:hypothetical protein
MANLAVSLLSDQVGRWHRGIGWVSLGGGAPKESALNEHAWVLLDFVDSVAGGYCSLTYHVGVGTTRPIKKWWRRRELNPRPRKPAMKRTTCVSDSVVVGRRIRTGKKTTA